jgi:hypothetical protein
MAASAEDGVAMIMAVMALLLMSALGAALILTSSSETVIAAHFRNGVEAGYAADAMMTRGLDMIAGLEDWAGPIAGAAQPALVDGALGPRILQDGSTLDLVQALNLANCHKTTACSASDLRAVTADRPWGANNPRWQPYAYGPLSGLLPASPAIESPFYVLLLVADDPAGSHQAPMAAGADGPVWEGIAVRAEAFGPRGAHKVVEVVGGRTVGAPDGEKDYNSWTGRSAMKISSWREVR